MGYQINILALAKQLKTPTMDWLGLRRFRGQTSELAARDGKPDGVQLTAFDGVMVEVRVNGHIGYCATNTLTESALGAAAARAHRVAEAAAGHAIHSFSGDVRPRVTGEYRSPGYESHGQHFQADHIELLHRLTQDLRVSDRVVKASATFATMDFDIEYANSDGSHTQQEFFMSGCDMRVVAQHAGRIQQRSFRGALSYFHQRGFAHFDANFLSTEAKRIGEEALELLAADECPTDVRDLVLAPDQMILQIHESIGHPLEIDRILGDERNYAGQSFVRLEDFGKLQYGSPLLNVSFDPTIGGEVASYAFDDTGNTAKKEAIIRDGVLLRGLGSLESQARANILGVANARVSSWNRPPIDRMANLNVEPGATSHADMIASIENGIYMETNCSWSIDDFRNKFQFGCELGRLIENGRLTRLVRNPNYRGISVPFWRSLQAVGDSSTFAVFGVPNCGKGEPNQTMWVGHATPTCAFSKVEIFGGGQ